MFEKKFQLNPMAYATFVIFVVVTLLSGLIYLIAQQSVRLGANELQIEQAEDLAAALDNGEKPTDVVSTDWPVSISDSLAPFVIVYDQTGKPIVSSAKLNDHVPVPPAGVFDYVNNKGEDLFTWQPQPGVRIAAVVISYKGADQNGFVLAGRSLREVESRENLLLKQVGMGWLFTELVVLGLYLVFRKKID